MSAIYTVQNIPVFRGARHYAQDVVLDRVMYRFEILRNDRDNGFYLDLWCGQELVAAGIRLVSGHDLLKPYSHNKLPPGRLLVVDLDAKTPGAEGLGRDPDPETFGDRVILVYQGV